MVIKQFPINNPDLITPKFIHPSPLKLNFKSIEDIASKPQNQQSRAIEDSIKAMSIEWLCSSKENQKTLDNYFNKMMNSPELNIPKEQKDRYHNIYFIYKQD
jgi:hypothetical protein